VDARPEPTAVPFSPTDRLDSWKSVAAHLHRDIRTVQRWEEFQGLPVHRLQHSKQGSIYAYKSEIDSWSTSRQQVSSKPKTPQSKRTSQSTAGIKSRYLRPAIYAVLGFAIALSGFSLARFFSSRQNARVVHFTTVKPIAIAVLPFQDLSSNSETSALAHTFTVALIKDLQRSKSIRVISAEPVAHTTRDLDDLQHIVNVLHADEAVEGSIRREGDRIHITAQLVDSATGTVVWTTQFERKAPDAPAVQDRVAHAVAVEIENASP
jgi:TolB-like protein